MKKELLGIFVCTLLITTSCFVVGANKDKENSAEPLMMSMVDEWPMFRHDLNHTGYSTCGTPNDNNVLWSTHIGDLESYSPPSVTNGYVYAGAMFSSGASLYCFNAFTGSQKWRFDVSDEFWGGPTIADGRVYILGDYYALYCLEADTGLLIWTYPIYGGNCPAVVDGKVYAGNYGDGVYCLNATTGDLIWTFDTTTDYQGCSPAVANGRVYIGSGPYNQPGTLYCLDADNGDEIWNYTTGSSIWSSPSIFDNKVYFASDQLYCYDAETGVEIWTVSGIYTTSSPAIAYEKVYIGDYGGKISCFDAYNGDLVWVTTIGGKSIWSSPAVADGKVYIAAHDPGDMICLDAETGAIIWTYNMSPTHVYSSPAIAYGNVYIGSGTTGNLIVFGYPNEPPETPTKPDGPSEGIVGVEYLFNSSTTDPEGDDIYYLFDWGDGTNSDWLGPYTSGSTGEGSHSWDEMGDYEIRVKAKDNNGSGETDWSDPHIITIVEGPILDIGAITGGLFKVKAKIKNTGDVDATGVQWSIKLEGGAFIGKETSGTDDIPASGEITATSSLIFGFGATVVTVTAEIPEMSDIREQDGFVFLFFIKVNPGG